MSARRVEGRRPGGSSAVTSCRAAPAARWLGLQWTAGAAPSALQKPTQQTNAGVPLADREMKPSSKVGCPSALLRRSPNQKPEAAPSLHGGAQGTLNVEAAIDGSSEFPKATKYEALLGFGLVYPYDCGHTQPASHAQHSKEEVRTLSFIIDFIITSPIIASSPDGSVINSAMKFAFSTAVAPIGGCRCRASSAATSSSYRCNSRCFDARAYVRAGRTGGARTENGGDALLCALLRCASIAQPPRAACTRCVQTAAQSAPPTAAPSPAQPVRTRHTSKFPSAPLGLAAGTSAFRARRRSAGTVPTALARSRPHGPSPVCACDEGDMHCSIADGLWNAARDSPCALPRCTSAIYRPYPPP